MTRDLRKLIDKMARANRLNTRGKRKFRRTFPKLYAAQIKAISDSLMGFAGKVLNEETVAAMMETVAAQFEPVEPIQWIESVRKDGDIMHITFTEQATRILRASGCEINQGVPQLAGNMEG